MLVPIHHLRHSLLLLLLSSLFLLSPASAEETASSTKEYDLQMTKGVAFFNAGRYPEAKEAFVIALSVRPNDSSAMHQKGVTAGKLGQFLEAEEDLSAVLAMPDPIPAAYPDLGIVYYQQKKYQEALSVLQRGAAFLPKDPLLPFYEGKIYQEMGDHPLAVARFSKSAAYAKEAESELYSAAIYHAGVSYYQMKNYEEAKEEFLEVVEKTPASAMGSSSKKFLALIAKQGQQNRRWSLSLNGGIQYDSNVRVRPDDFAFAISKKADSRLVATLNGRYRFLEKADWGIDGGYLFYQSLHSDLSSFNAQVHQPSLTATWKKDGQVRRLDYTFGYTMVGQAAYLVSHTLKPTLFFTPSRGFQRSVFYQLQRKDFIDSTLFPISSNRDGTNQAIGVAASMQKGQRLWKMGYTADMEDVRSADWEYVGHKINGGMQSPFSARLSGEIGLEYARRAYRYPNSFAIPIFSKKRSDDILTAHTELSYRIRPKSDLSFGYSLTRNDSNIELFDYRRGIFSFNFMRRF